MAGFEGFELNISQENTDNFVNKLNFQENPQFTLSSSDEEIYAIYEMSQQIGIKLSSISTSLHWTYSLTSEDEKIRQKGIDVVERMIDAGSILHVDTVLVVPGLVNEKVSYMEAYKRSLDAFKKLRTKAEQNNIYIGIENVWNKFLLSPIEMRNFIDEIGSEYVKCYFDVGNVLQYSYPEYWIEVLGKYIKKVHVKDYDISIGNISGFKPLLQGDVDWAKVMKALRSVGYDDFITAELVPYKTTPEMLALDTSRHMDEIFKL